MKSYYVLVEWVGRWSIARYNEDPAPLFQSEADARAWVARIYKGEGIRRYANHDSLDDIMTRFRLIPATLPDRLTPVYPTPRAPWNGAYEEQNDD